MEIKKLDATDFEDFDALIQIFYLVFEHEGPVPNKKYLIKLLTNPNFIVFVVKINGQVVGGLTVFVLFLYYQLNPSAYLYDVGIRPEFQRQGLGKKLIAEVCKYCKENNFNDAFVQAEITDEEAISFYRKTNFSHEITAKHFTYSFADKS